jgi:hypothetical protein
LVGLAAAQLVGQHHLVGLDRHCADVAGQALTPVPGLSSTTAAGLARRITDPQWAAVATGLATVTARMLTRLSAAGREALLSVRAGITFAIGVKRSAALWRTLATVGKSDWVDAIDMPGAQVAVANYIPAWWPTDTRLLIRRVRLDSDQISSDPRARRRRTLHPDQRTLPIDELAAADAVYSYSFILTNCDVSTPARAAAVEHWWQRTEIENIFRDAKHGAALRHLPSGYAHVNRAWMWGALIATSLAGWLHHRTAGPGGGLLGWGGRDGKAMIATLRHRLLCVPGRLIRHATNSPCACPQATTRSPKS